MQRHGTSNLVSHVGFMLVFTETTVAEVVLLAGLTAVFITVLQKTVRGIECVSDAKEA
jgi:hypothetical protein